MLFTFNPSSGKSVDKDLPFGQNLPYDVEQTILLPHHGKQFSLYKAFRLRYHFIKN